MTDVANSASALHGRATDTGVKLDDDFDGPDETDECWNCDGAGGYAVCCEDSCPHIYGEEGCDDDACWRVCSVCRGEGAI